MQIKAIMRYHFTTTILAIIKNKTKNKTSVREGVDKLQLSDISDGNVKSDSHCGKWFDSSSEIQQFHS